MIRWPSTAFLLASAVLAPPVARAGSAVPVSIEDRGDQVAILVAGARTSADRPESRGDRLELPLDQALPAIEIKLEDATVRKVELRTQPPSLRVQLRHGSESTRLAAEMAELSQQGDHLEILLPREPRAFARARSARTAIDPATAAAAAAPTEVERAPAGAPIPAAQVAPPAPAPAPAIADPRAAAVQPAPAPASDVSRSDPAAADRTAAQLAGAPPASHGPALDLDRAAGGSGSPLGTTVALGALAGLAAIGGLWLRRRRSSAALQSPLEILAQVPVGPRARVIWLSAGRREMLISVSEKDVRVLGQWMADGARAGTASGDSAPADESDQPAGTRPERLATATARLRNSPSLTGLLRLRDQHAAMESGAGTHESGVVHDALAEDSEWARQLVAATTRGAKR